MNSSAVDPSQPLAIVGRYAIYGKLAQGGMATVHMGRLLGPVGFSRTVAIKRLHPQFAKDPEFVAMFLDEARLAARIQHPNVVATVDVVAMQEELFLVMDYVRGESFSKLIRLSKRRESNIPLGIISGVLTGVLHGLHAAHEAKDERGNPLSVVHRDVSPQNLLVGIDGVPRILDFGVAKAAARVQVTRDGQMKGKLSYMSPEQLTGKPVDRRTDVWAAGVVLWEALAQRRLFVGDDAAEILRKILTEPLVAPSQLGFDVHPGIEAVLMRALDRNYETRYQTAREFALALEAVQAPASAVELGNWVELLAGEELADRENAVANMESFTSISEVTGTARGFMKTLDGRQSLPGDVQSFLEKQRKAQSAKDDGDDAATTVYQPMKAGAAPVALGSVHSRSVVLGGISEIPEERGRNFLWLLAGMGTVVSVILLWSLGQDRGPISVPIDLVMGNRSAEETRDFVPAIKEEERQERIDIQDDVQDVDRLPEENAEAENTGESAVEEANEAASQKAVESVKPVAKKASATPNSATQSPNSAATPVSHKEPSRASKAGNSTSAPAYASDCSTPYYFDAKGIKRIKAACL